MSQYIVKTATAKMPLKVKARYGKVAVLEVEDGIENVSMISTHAKGVIRIIAIWDRLFWGKTEKCAYRQALVSAHDLAQELNNAKNK